MHHVNSRDGHTIAVSEDSGYRSDRQADRVERQRSERLGADPGGHSKMGFQADPRILRGSGSVSARLGQDSHGLAGVSQNFWP